MLCKFRLPGLILVAFAVGGTAGCNPDNPDLEQILNEGAAELQSVKSMVEKLQAMPHGDDKADFLEQTLVASRNFHERMKRVGDQPYGTPRQMKRLKALQAESEEVGAVVKKEFDELIRLWNEEDRAKK
jgi:hypothetical protein